MRGGRSQRGGGSTSRSVRTVVWDIERRNNLRPRRPQTSTELNWGKSLNRRPLPHTPIPAVNAWWKDGVPKAVNEVVYRGLYKPIEIRKNQFVLGKFSLPEP
jgi:hypothetical protein